MTKTKKISLYQALASLHSEKEFELFFLDLCTPGERKAFEERWEIAQILQEGEMSYRDISAKTGASTTTVARVNRFLNQERHHGYKMVLDRLKKGAQ